MMRIWAADGTAQSDKSCRRTYGRHLQDRRSPRAAAGCDVLGRRHRATVGRGWIGDPHVRRSHRSGVFARRQSRWSARRRRREQWPGVHLANRRRGGRSRISARCPATLPKSRRNNSRSLRVLIRCAVTRSVSSGSGSQLEERREIIHAELDRRRYWDVSHSGK